MEDEEEVSLRPRVARSRDKSLWDTDFRLVSEILEAAGEEER